MSQSVSEKWRRASRPAVEGGILSTLRSSPATEDGEDGPPGKITRMAMPPKFYRDALSCATFSAGLEARLYVSQDGRRYTIQRRAQVYRVLGSARTAALPHFNRIVPT